MNTTQAIKGRGEWLVTVGGSSSVSRARVISRHRSWERAQQRASKERLEMGLAGDHETRCGIMHADEFLALGGVLPGGVLP